jgi:hypothetical protein
MRSISGGSGDFTIWPLYSQEIDDALGLEDQDGVGVDLVVVLEAGVKADDEFGPQVRHGADQLQRQRATAADQHEGADRTIQLAGLPPRPPRRADPGRAEYPSLAEYAHAMARYAAGTPIAPEQTGLGGVGENGVRVCFRGPNVRS